MNKLSKTISYILLCLLFFFGLAVIFEHTKTEDTDDNGKDSSSIAESSVAESSVAESSVAEIVTHSISYDVLGSGSMSSIEFNCPTAAETGKIVTFTANVLDDELEIYRVVLEDEDGEESDSLIAADGVYSFTMPDFDAVVLFYLTYITE